MGVFTCAKCQSSYCSQRFFWEKAPENSTNFLGDFQDNLTSVTAEDCKPKDGNVNSSDDEPLLASDVAPASVCAPDIFSIVDVAQQTVDVAQATASATAALFTSLTTQLAPLAELAPLATCLGAAGAVCGAAQLHAGLSASSDTMDPHVVAKGAVGLSMGCSCLVMAAAPGVVAAAAVGTGIVGVGMSAAIDATVGGLCDNCREDAQQEFCGQHRDVHSTGVSDESMDSSKDNHLVIVKTQSM